MTLVMPYGPEQIGSGSLFSRSGRGGPSMPCVFDGESLDFESALLTADWNSDIYETPADEFPPKAPSDASELKRKCLPSECEEEAPASPPKKPRVDEPAPSPSSSSSSSPSSSSSESHDEDGVDDDEYVPRRRGPQMWNSRQRWKDERKRVLKLSIGKLAEIEDPEHCMHRSVVINNTVKRLHADIKNERQAKLQAKLRHRQQRMDYFNERFHADAFSSSAPKAPARDLYDDSSCDEIFGVSEDFLRVTIPDRRVSSPVPSEQPMDMSESRPQTTCYSNSASSSPFCHRRATSTCSSTPFTHHSSNSSTNPSATAANSPRRPLVNSGSQCATQFRTSRDLSSDSSFPPRVPILDSVVYHSLLASLESS